MSPGLLVNSHLVLTQKVTERLVEQALEVRIFVDRSFSERSTLEEKNKDHNAEGEGLIFVR